VHAEEPSEYEVSISHSNAGSGQQDLQYASSEVMAVSASGVWTATGSMLVARRDHTATLLTDGRVLIVGWFTTVAELYDPATRMFKPTGNTLHSHGQQSTATRLLDGRVLIAGGTQALTFAEIYDPASGIFSATGNLNAPHFAHTATLLKDGRVLLAGGADDLQTGVITTAIAELYDPAAGTFSLTGSLNTDRDGSSSVLLQDGRVLIVGGTVTTTPGNGVCTDTAELYDPTSGIFHRTGNMTEPRCDLLFGQGLVLKNGKALIVGGLSNQSAELFDPMTGNFGATGTMALRQFTATSILLSNGQVFVTGGFSAIGPVTTNSVELYDPTSGTFAVTASMSAARQQHTATLLLNGQVLVTGGGFDDGPELSSAELFTLLNPIITSASIDHKNLIVMGERFDSGAVILLNEGAQKTLHDDQNPNTLIGKKVGRKIDSGQTVNLQVRNPNGTLSQGFSFTRP
jgi:hypothetical protein